MNKVEFENILSKVNIERGLLEEIIIFHVIISRIKLSMIIPYKKQYIIK